MTQPPQFQPQSSQSPYAPPYAYGYVSPYQVPAAGRYGAPFDPVGLLRPARRAAVLMFVLGGIVGVLGMCNIAGAILQSPAEILENQRRMFGDQGAPPMPISAQGFRNLAMGFAIFTVVFGLGMVVLGALVRRGSVVASGFSIGLAAIALLGDVLMLLGSVIAAFGSPVFLACTCGTLVPGGLFGLLIFWLIQGMRAIAAHRTFAAQYQAQYWQYQQAQQAYGYGGGGGYAQPGAPGQPPVQQAPLQPPQPPAPQTDDAPPPPQA